MATELAIIGAGNMAEAIARGVISAGVFQPEQMIASDVSPQRRELFSNDLKIRAVESNLDAVRGARRVLLSVKPQKMAEALAGIGDVLDEDSLVISIAAGLGSDYIEKNLGPRQSWRVVRSMPNTPMLVGEGMVALSRGKNATTHDLQDARRIFQSAATVIDVDENKLDAVTAISGSGPAYFFFLVEQMEKAGVELGLTPQQAKQLAAKTCLGAGRMLATSTDSPQELRRKVTSPGGTTHAAISHMESAGVPQILVDAMKAADARSKQLRM